MSNSVVAGSGVALPALNPNAVVNAWAADGFAMLDLWGWNFVAYGYAGKGVGTTGLFYNGIDVIGGARTSDGGILQAAYTFNEVFTVGASWGVSHLKRPMQSQHLRVRAMHINRPVRFTNATKHIGRDKLPRQRQLVLDRLRPLRARRSGSSCRLSTSPRQPKTRSVKKSATTRSWPELLSSGNPEPRGQRRCP